MSISRIKKVVKDKISPRSRSIPPPNDEPALGGIQEIDKLTITTAFPTTTDASSSSSSVQKIMKFNLTLLNQYIEWQS
ncbi:3576_t:CDS:2 [Ambispora gerdemannii]|uniref:3576_t:CDS:1 n=1 Tax=Ambispora gerdemannii TaxID=144530 RepID=A0A9N9APC1_9GLOM|nr:3576_t:CDS:2 [Ambispora gerdemannii]